MEMLDKQEQEILDNAPTAATHYSLNHAGDVVYTYANLCIAGVVNGDFKPLADLHKKGKTVVDAVNAYKAELVVGVSAAFVTYDSHLGCYGIGSNACREETRVCTIEEFNQCVDDLSKYANKHKGAHAPYTAYDYEQHKLDNKVKASTKVEYVPMTTSHHYEIFKAMHDDGDVYVRCEDGEYEGMQGCIINLADAIHDEVTIYRKVEVEIKTEKRWLMYEESSDTFTPCREDQGAVVGFQIIEITVEV
jgi:hypothetical protein